MVLAQGACLGQPAHQTHQAYPTETVPPGAMEEVPAEQTSLHSCDSLDHGSRWGVWPRVAHGTICRLCSAPSVAGG